MANSLEVDDLTIVLDKEGYLANLSDWNPRVARKLAESEAIELTDAHWEVIHIIRGFHARRGLAPVMRILVRLMERHCGPDKGNSLYLLSLFPGNPSRLAAKIAGLPRPSNCL